MSDPLTSSYVFVLRDTLLIAIVKLVTGQNHVFQSVFIHYQSFQDVFLYRSVTVFIINPEQTSRSIVLCSQASPHKEKQTNCCSDWGKLWSKPLSLLNFIMADTF